MRSLLICHGSFMDEAVAQVPGTDIDVLPYGSTTASAPDGTRLISLPELGGGHLATLRALVGLLRELRSRRYDIVYVAAQSLGRHWFRGPLLLFPHLTGARRVVAVSGHETHVSISLPRAAADALLWILLFGGSIALGHLLALIADRVPERKRSPAPATGGGSVAYLRTDIELHGTTLVAGGSLAHTVGIIEALDRSEFDVSVWSTGGIAGVEDDRLTTLPVISPANVPVEMSELLSGLRQSLALARRRPDSQTFVYQRYSLNNLAGAIAARRWGVPLILEVNSSEVRWRESWSQLRLPRVARACERTLLRQADRIVAVSDVVRRDLIDEGGDPRKIVVVPNGVDVERFAAATPRQLPVPGDAFVVAFVGLFYPWHGVHVLAEAFCMLHRERPSARLLLIGEGAESARTTAVLEAGGARDATLMPGLVPRADVPGYLAAAHVVVSPHAAIRDFIGSPIKVFEYMACGRAIVATRVGQMATLLRDRETALIVPPEDPAALAAALVDLYDDPQLRLRLGAAAQAEARAQHSWDARVAAILGGSEAAPDGTLTAAGHQSA